MSNVLLMNRRRIAERVATNIGFTGGFALMCWGLATFLLDARAGNPFTPPAWWRLGAGVLITFGSLTVETVLRRRRRARFRRVFGDVRGPATAPAKMFTAADDDPHFGPGTVVAVHYGNYRRQEIWYASGIYGGNWYPLGGDAGKPQVAEDPRNELEKMNSREPWRQPPGTIPRHPHFADITARGPVTLLVAAQADTYAAGWRDGRQRLVEQFEELRDEEDVPPGYGWRTDYTTPPEEGE